jgi:hypothetical protein
MLASQEGAAFASTTLPTRAPERLGTAVVSSLGQDRGRPTLATSLAAPLLGALLLGLLVLLLGRFRVRLNGRRFGWIRGTEQAHR